MRIGPRHVQSPVFAACVAASLHLHRRLEADARLRPDDLRKRGDSARILVFELVEPAHAARRLPDPRPPRPSTAAPLTPAAGSNGK